MKKEMTYRQENRADQLQFLRFCAFLVVFLWHCFYWLPSGLPGSCIAAEAVSFFFILSGTVTGYSSYGKQVELSCCSILSYMWKKLKKFYPLYFTTMMVALIYSTLPDVVMKLDYQGMYAHAKQIVKNVLMIQPWFPGSYHTYNGPSWFLAVIMSFALLNLPAIKLLNEINIKKNRNVRFALLFILLASTTVIYCYMTQSVNKSYWHYSFPLSRLPEYLCGMVIGFVVRGKLERDFSLTERKGLFTVLEIGTIAFCLICPFGSVPDWAYFSVYWMLPNFLLLTVFCFGKGYVSELFRKKPLKWLGDISFECYIVHYIVICLMVDLHGTETTSALGDIFLLCYCFMVVILVVVFIKDANLGQKAEDTLRAVFSKKA